MLNLPLIINNIITAPAKPIAKTNRIIGNSKSFEGLESLLRIYARKDRSPIFLTIINLDLNYYYETTLLNLIHNQAH